MKQLEGFEKVDVYTIKENVFDQLQNEWMLITAGSVQDFNTMTAAWGGFGILWQKPVATIFIRPQRFTYKFTEEQPTFSLSFFGHDKYRDALSFCGTKSGRDYNKPQEVGLTPALTSANNIAFQEARLVFDCRKIYADDIKPAHFFDKDLEKSIYPQKDYHRFYIGEIVGCYKR